MISDLIVALTVLFALGWLLAWPWLAGGWP